MWWSSTYSDQSTSRACARDSKFGQDASLTHVYVASRRARAVRAKCSLAGLTTAAKQPRAACVSTWLGEVVICEEINA